MKLKLAIGMMVICCSAILFIAYRAISDTEQPFNQVVLPTDNEIANLTNNSYYDTVASVALNAAGISGILLQIAELTDGAKSQFEGELKAHVRYYDGIYFLYIADLNKKQCIDVISHEVVHISQYESGNLSYDLDTGELIWMNNAYDVLDMPYDSRPWESDAYNRQGEISSYVKNILY